MGHSAPSAKINDPSSYQKRGPVCGLSVPDTSGHKDGVPARAVGLCKRNEAAKGRTRVTQLLHFIN